MIFNKILEIRREHKKVRVLGLGRGWLLAALTLYKQRSYQVMNVTLPSSILPYHGGLGGRNLDFLFNFKTYVNVCLFAILCIYSLDSS